MNPFANLKECPQHGRHTTAVCPLCDRGGAVAASATPEPSESPQPEQDRSKWYSGPENDLHEWFETWLMRHGVSYVHARTDVKSTIANGWPDFTCMRDVDGDTLSCLVEFKNRAGRLRKDQIECIDDLASKGIQVLVTGDFKEACAFVRARLEMPEE